MQKWLLLICVLWLLISTPSYGQNYSNSIEIDLITISPGEFYWSAFGHTALRVKTDNYDKLFGFGYFDFEEEYFFLKFAKGEMQYFLGVNESSYELADYQQQGRQIVSQRLDLTSKQKHKLLTKLIYLAQPENRYYHYDYFLNNCTSRIRDLLDEVSDGEISKQLTPQLTQHSWNDLTFPAANQAWMNLGIAYIYGLPAYAKKNQWQLSVFPEIFSKDLKNIDTENNWNKSYRVLFEPSKQHSRFAEYSFIQTHYAVILLVVLLIIGLLIKPLASITIHLWLVTQSLLGIGLLLLWFFTQHKIAAWNINILLFSPMAWVLLFKSIRKKQWIMNAYLIVNSLWLIAASLTTNLYLLGFCVINLLVYFKCHPK